jgi:perosamine synthetase
MSLVESWSVVEQFERRMAAYCGAPHAVAVDTCTAAIFLCLSDPGLSNGGFKGRVVTMPARTYLGVACVVKHAGGILELTETDWGGAYPIETYGGEGVVDSACCLRREMFKDMPAGCPVCLSFQSRKHLKIGRGGMILTDDAEAAAWFRKARFCGRPAPGAPPEFVGWHCFMEPERAARGLTLMDSLPDENEDLQFEYPDLRQYEVLR